MPRTVSVCAPFVSSVVSSVQLAGAETATDRICPSTQNSTRVTGVEAVARKGTSPTNGLVPAVGATVTTGPLAAEYAVAAKSSNVPAPANAAPRPTPASPGPVIAPSWTFSAQFGLPDHVPSGASHWRVSV